MAGTRAATAYVGVVSLSLLTLGLYIVGTARYLTNHEENTCEMTYMFEYPQYVRIALSEEVDESYPRYGLYAYGEGFVTQKLRRMKFSGIPVLFVPGNAGSYEQARSLASVSLRKSIKDRTSFHFDYFTVSLGNDYSALYGGVLEDETSYVNLCMSRILSLYDGKVDKIVVIGHSMGGIIAKGALLRTLDPNGSSNGSTSPASILVTLASPHRPIFLPDRTIARYYENLENSEHRLRDMEITFVSIGGGDRDVLVGSSQTLRSSADLRVLTSGMPDVWRSTDHLCILWCKQLIMTIVRALFDCVDKNARPPTITSDNGRKFRALAYHFTSRVAGKKFRTYEETQKFESGGEWIEDIRRQYTWTSKSRDSNKTVFLMIRMDSSSYDSLTLETVNLEAKDWLFGCSAYAIEGHSRVCEWGWNLTNRTRLSADPLHRLRKRFHVELKDLRNFKSSHLVVRIPESELRGKKSSVTVHVDLHRAGDRTLTLGNSNGLFETLFRTFRASSVLSPNPRVAVSSSRGNLGYRVVLDDVSDVVSIDVEPTNDDGSAWTRSSIDGRIDENPQAILELVQYSNDRGFSSAGQVRAINFKDGDSGKKHRVVMHVGGKNGTLMISLGPEYGYRMTIRRAGIVERVAASVRERWPMLYPIIIALCLLGIATRIDHSPRKTAITCGITFAIAAILDCIFETLVAVGLVHVFAVTTCCLVVFFGSVAHNIAARFLARIAALPNLWFDWIIAGLDRLPILTTLVLLSLISATCGALAILLSVGLFFLKLTRMYDDYVETLLMASLRQLNPFGRPKRKRKRREPADSTEETVNGARHETMFNGLILFVTWSFAAVPAIPSVHVWAKNFRYETRLTTEDPTMFYSWLVLTGWASLGFVVIPPNESGSLTKSRRLFCGTILRSTAWVLLSTACFEKSAYYQWTVPPLVAMCVTCVAFLSLFPASSHPVNENSIDGKKSERSRIQSSASNVRDSSN